MILALSELEGLIDARQKLESQQQENQGVKSEFAQLDDDANIYKLIGPVLLKQDKTEAVMAVNSRLEFIEKEMLVSCIWPSFFINKCHYSKRIEREIGEKQEESEKKRAEVMIPRILAKFYALTTC